MKSLTTRKGEIHFPAYLPVTTFGEKYPLDKLIQPYLPRLASGVMVSQYYAKQFSGSGFPIPMFVDSGGFAGLFQNAEIVERNGLGIIQLTTDEGQEVIHPKDVLELQSQIADVAFSLDLPIPPGLDEEEAQRRQILTIANAHWALNNLRRRDLPLYACIQAWDVESARACARAYEGCGFSGIAIGGMVPRARDKELVLAIARAVREEISNLPLHVFGIGNLELVGELYAAGVDSVDSSSYVKAAADGKLWGSSKAIQDPTPLERMHIALCNLATATGKTLPLSVAPMLFRSKAIQ